MPPSDMGAGGGGHPKTTKTRKNQVFKGFGGIQGIQGHGGNHRSGFPEYGPMPWSGDPIQARFDVFRAWKSGPEGSGRLQEGSREAPEAKNEDSPSQNQTFWCKH